MAGETRFARRDWYAGNNGELYPMINQGVFVALLMDLRDQNDRMIAALEAIARTLACHNFQRIPTTLRTISRNTAKPRKKARRGA